MAYDKIIPIHSRLDHCVAYVLNHDKTALDAVLSYTRAEEKNGVPQADTETLWLETAINCSLETACRDMTDTKIRWGKDGDGHVRGYHLIHSFAPGEVTPEQAHVNGVEFAERLLGDRYEVVVSTHLDRGHVHCHLLFNSVSFVDGRMYRNNFKDYFGDIRGVSNEVSEKYGLSVISPTGKGKQYSEWSAEQSGKPTIRDTVRRDIDAAIASAYTYKTFLQELRRQGYTIKCGPNVMHAAVRPPGGTRNIRLDGLGADYTEEAIKTRLTAIRSGNSPQAEPTPPQPPVWRIPGKRYCVRDGLLHRRPRKLTGFRALYFKYLYLLGAIRKGRPSMRTAFVMRQDLIQFDRYQKQFSYLHKNHIETAAQLSMQYDALQSVIDTQADYRRDLYNIKRTGHGGESIAEEIAGVTEQLRILRRELKLCVRIEGDIKKVREHMQTARNQDRSHAYEKTNQSRLDRHSAPDGDPPANSTRIH